MIPKIKCCLNCKDRAEKCHAYCERYKAEKEEYEKAKERIDKERHAEASLEGRKIEAIRRMMRK